MILNSIAQGTTDSLTITNNEKGIYSGYYSNFSSYFTISSTEWGVDESIYFYAGLPQKFKMIIYLNGQSFIVDEFDKEYTSTDISNGIDYSRTVKLTAPDISGNYRTRLLVKATSGGHSFNNIIAVYLYSV